MLRWVKSGLLAGASAGAVLLAMPVHAQTTTADPAEQDTQAGTVTPGTVAAGEAANETATAPQEGGGPSDTIVVTGSRIVRDGYTAPTPVTVAPVTDLVKSTPTSIPDGLNKLPQFSLSSSPARSTHNFANSASNGNILNLRGVGGVRTLILFDGLRMPPTTFNGQVDVDVIPNALISRVDVVTAGASAAYGSDAVAGVVNFVLNKKFTGITGTAQYGISERGDNANYRLGLAGGFDFMDGAGHLLLSGEYFENKGMGRSDRASALAGYQYAGAVPGSAAAPGSAANPYRLYSGVRQNSATDGGLILSGPLRDQRFLPGGTTTPFVHGARTGSSAYEVGGDGYTIPADVTAVAPNKRYQLFGRLSYDVSPDISVYAQGIYTNNKLQYTSLANSFVSPTFATIQLDNPYLNLTPAQRAAVTAAGQSSVQVAAYNSYGPKPRTDEETDFWMATAGAEGKLGGFDWNVAYTHGDSDHQVAQSGLFDWRKAYAAIDAVRDGSGNIVCRATLNPDPAIRSAFSDCRPLNILGDGSTLTTPAGYAYATGTSRYRARFKQDMFAVNLQGSLFELPAGPVDIAVGGEYRRQKLNLTTNADPALLDTAAERNAYFAGVNNVPASALFYWLTNVGSARGKVNVKEAYAEINVPVLKDMAFAQALDLNAAGRITDYSTSGTVKTWKLGATWKPVDDLLLRVTRSRDIRAPTLFDLFAGDQSSIGTLVDVPVTQGGSGTTANVNLITGGNPNLDPEIADTFTYGAVFSPSFLPGFSLSVDYFKLKIDDAIGTLGSSQIVQNCAASGGTAPECALITRPGANQFPTGIRVAPANIAFLKTSGIDIDASYRTEAGPGQLSLRLYANYLDSYKTQQSATAPVFEFAGRGLSGNQPVARPKWRGTFNVNYDVGNFSFFVSEQYIGKFKLGSQEPNQIYENPHFGAVWYTDTTISYKVPAYTGNVELFLTVNNLFDRKPPLVAGTIPGLNLPTIISVYDQVGRAFTFGTRFKF